MTRLNFSLTDGNQSVYADNLHVDIVDINDFTYNEESRFAKAVSKLLSLSSNFSIHISQTEIPDSEADVEENDG